MNGQNGVSIANARIDNGDELILELSDGNEISAGRFPYLDWQTTEKKLIWY